MSLTDAQRPPAEVMHAEELARLRESDTDPRPPGWRLSLRAVRTFLCGDAERGIEPAPPALHDSVTQPSPDVIEVYFSTTPGQLDQVRVFWDCTGVA